MTNLEEILLKELHELQKSKCAVCGQVDYCLPYHLDNSEIICFACSFEREAKAFKIISRGNP